jgi:predicted acyl esterase
MEKDNVYKIDLTPMSTSKLLLKATSIRIEISSSTQRFARNLEIREVITRMKRRSCRS